MATCPVQKIDSNVTGLAIAEEVCLKQLPTVAEDGADPVWYGYEPNSYADFGGENTSVARAPIDPSRQNKKGTITDLDASGGFNVDFTKTNIARLLQGFFFADWRQKPTTAPMNAAPTLITSVSAATDTYAAAAGLLPFNIPGLLVFASGLGIPANNGLKTVVSATAIGVTVAEALVLEAASPAAAKLQTAGMQFADGDIDVLFTGGVASLTSTVFDFTTLNLVPGERIFVGGDAAATQFVNNQGWAQVASVAANSLVLEDTSWTPVTEDGAAKTIRIFFGSVLKNENVPSLIKRRSYNVERTLGMGATATQAEYLEGAVANQFTLNIPQAEKLNADLTFVACDNTYRSGEVGDTVKAGTRIAAPGEDAYNTSSDVARLKMSVIDPTSPNPSALFGYVSEATIAIDNGVTPNKAVGVLGAFDTSAANFSVSGSMTAYFSTVAAVRAVRNNADVALSMSVAAKNAGWSFEMPLIGLGGGRINVEKDAPITVPLTPNAAENKYGFTLMVCSFPYLPNLAMPA